MPKKVKNIKASLLRKGFVVREGDHTYFYYKTIEGKETTIRTKFSHGKREYDDHLLSLVSKQLEISRSELLELIECPLDRKGYEEKLRTIEEL